MQPGCGLAKGVPKAHRAHHCRGTGAHVQRPPRPRPRLSRLFGPRGPRVPAAWAPAPAEPPPSPSLAGATSSALHLPGITPALLGPGHQPHLPRRSFCLGSTVTATYVSHDLEPWSPVWSCMPACQRGRQGCVLQVAALPGPARPPYPGATAGVHRRNK